MALTAYQNKTQLLLHDTSGQLYQLSDITSYINTARSQLALEAECVRFLYGVDGLYLTGTFTLGSPVITVVSPVVGTQVVVGQTIISPNVIGGAVVTAIDTGANTITLSNNATAGAVASQFQLTPSYAINTQVNQEIYPLPQNVNTGQGIKDVIAVKSITVNWGAGGGSNAPMLQYWDFTTYQAYLRYYGQTGLGGQPCVWTRYQNNVLIRPVASSVYPMQWDTICSVIDLTDDNTPEAIPYPFTDAIPYYAAYLALFNSQRAGDAQMMLEEYEKFARRARAFWQRTIIPNVYYSGYR